MRYVYADLESFYSNEYSLRKMTPIEYVLDPRFELIGCAVAIDDGPATWLDGPEFEVFLKKLGPDCAMVTHNALFDQTVFSFRYNFVPKLMIDTMSMARALLLHRTRGVSLKEVAAALNIGAKGDTIHKVAGMNAAAIKAAGLWESYTEYAVNDVELCREIYKKLRADFPAEEHLINDMVIRACVQPQFKLDAPLLAQHLAEVRAAKQSLLDQCGVPKEDLMSNDKFAVALRTLGIEPPTKVSPITGKQAWAFAKTDAEFSELAEDDDPRVQALVAARLGNKTTIEETRTERLLKISQLEIPGQGKALMPIPLKFSGAHTHRFSGDWKLNMQNLPRGGNLRRAIIAPDGHDIVTCDASQIEARLTAWLAGCTDLVTQFAAGADVYSNFASEVYGYPCNKIDHKTERFLGKTSILGLGFGMGPPKFEKTVHTQARSQNVSIEMDLALATQVVSLYRTKYREIPASWRRLDALLPALANGGTSEMFGPCKIEHQAILLPSGLRLKYHNLRQETINGKTSWVYEYAGRMKFTWGGTLMENVVQALDRVIVMNAALRIRDHLKSFEVPNPGFQHQVHDELVYVVPSDISKVVRKLMEDEMSKRPEWAPDLPLAAESGVGRSYGEAK